jgi:GTP cyclohydrolase I
MTTPEDAVRTLLGAIKGEDLTREGLKETPARYVKALAEMTSGYFQKAEDVLGTTFAAEGVDQIVVVKGIEFSSLCEHHMLPFVGTVDVGYLPDRRIVGLSKVPRLVELHSRRLQVQERLTADVAHDLERVLRPHGVAVVVEAHHSCMGCRGVRKPTASMVTSSMGGAFRASASARAEVLGLFGRS